MAETIEIFPEYDKLQGVSAFWSNDEESIVVPKQEYDYIEQLVKELQIADKIDNLCYIVYLLKKENGQFTQNKRLKNKFDTIYKNRLEFSKYLKLQKSERSIRITKIKLELGKLNGFDIKSNSYQFEKKGSFEIEDDEIAHILMNLLLEKYESKSSYKDDFPKFLKKQVQINKETILRKNTAHGLKRYFSVNTNLSENKQYYLIGCLFQLSGIEKKFTEKNYSQIINKSVSLPYKSFADFITTNIRNKYFKRG